MAESYFQQVALALPCEAEKLHPVAAAVVVAVVVAAVVAAVAVEAAVAAVEIVVAAGACWKTALRRFACQLLGQTPSSCWH